MTSHKKIVLLFIIFYIVFPLRIFAVSSYPFPQEYKQPSGKTFEASQWGDEWNNGIATKDGHSIYKNDKTGNWEYYNYKYLDFIIIDLRIGQPPFNLIVGDVDPSSLNVGNKHRIVINIDSYTSYILVGILCSLLIFFIPAWAVLFYRWKRYGLANNRRFFTVMICLSVFIVLLGGMIYYRTYALRHPAIDVR